MAYQSDRVTKAGFLVGAVILSPSPAAALGRLFEGGTLGYADTLSLLDFYLATFPLTTATAIWFGYVVAISDKGANFMGVMVLAAILLGGGTVLGLYLGLGTGNIVVEATDVLGGPGPGAIGVVTGLLTFYARAYGLWTFFCSLLAGGFVGWAYNELK